MNEGITREFIRDDDGSWFARVVEFPGCMTVGRTRKEAEAMLNDAIDVWLEEVDSYRRPLWLPGNT